MGTILYRPAEIKGSKSGSTIKGKFFGRILRNTTISVDDLNDLIASDSQVERSEVAQVTDAIFKQIEELVLNGHSIKVGTLGSLSVRFNAKAVNAAEKVTADTIRKVNVRLYESKYVKMPLKSTRMEIAPAILTTPNW